MNISDPWVGFTYSWFCFLGFFSRIVDYEDASLTCALPTYAPIPEWVVLASHPCGVAHATLKVINMEHRRLEYNYTVCLHKALIKGYNDITQFVEWVEVNKILGAEHFVVYNYSGSSHLKPYIDYYVDATVMDYRSWPLHSAEKYITQYRAQVALMNDCMYRYMYRTKYLILTDADEFLIRKNHSSWEELLNDSPCRGAPNAMFQNVFFVGNLLDPRYVTNPSLSFLKIKTLMTTRQYSFTYPCLARSKIILQPDKVVSVITHMVTELVNKTDKKTCCMPSELGYSAHYRKRSKEVRVKVEEAMKQMNSDDDPQEEELRTDTVMYNYQSDIVANIRVAHEAVQKERMRNANVSTLPLVIPRQTHPLAANLSEMISQWRSTSAP